MFRDSMDKMEAMLRGSMSKMDSNYLAEPDVAMMSTEPAPTAAYQAKSPLFRECMAEFLGMLVFMLFGTGVVAQVVLSEGSKGEFLSINLCWGLGILFGIHVCGGVSGAHLNPAVTVSLALFGRFKWKKVPYYVAAQLLGAFGASAIVCMVYAPLINATDPHKTETQGIFATYPYSDDVPTGTCFLTEVVGTALLVGCLFAIGDDMNKPASPYSQPGAVALLVVAIGMAFGMNTGYAINPARDLGPRLFSLCAGWGTNVFTLNDSYFWVPIVAPILGGPIGAGMYVVLVEQHHPVEYSHQRA
ncbi:aquaporin, putative [Phytophthora infestans T30-4]|uniref:Aquaporin, putative n=2 Tax=Phytophthora infestans TaxID=4787 RepID=D0NBH3_PHYIT|nr:aquaporin, putative [Phytophthora infestans T30-4]EEY55402.1 aquaporin, putative [Phytophthora infestans T30-4]KAF4035442.1 Major intrinsic protein [Phytophthora infestans]|eukprot:XP_002903626.1 aquaporin, putative [Phytophthora infestans T30-4]